MSFLAAFGWAAIGAVILAWAAPKAAARLLVFVEATFARVDHAVAEIEERREEAERERHYRELLGMDETVLRYDNLGDIILAGQIKAAKRRHARETETA